MDGCIQQIVTNTSYVAFVDDYEWDGIVLKVTESNPTPEANAPVFLPTIRYEPSESVLLGKHNHTQKRSSTLTEVVIDTTDLLAPSASLIQ